MTDVVEVDNRNPYPPGHVHITRTGPSELDTLKRLLVNGMLCTAIKDCSCHICEAWRRDVCKAIGHAYIPHRPQDT